MGVELYDLADVYAVQLPGRRDRIRESPIDNVPEIIDSLVPILGRLVDENTIFFGHSLGAILAYEMAVRFQESNRLIPQHVIVSGHTSPNEPYCYDPISDLPSEEFFRELQELGGMHPSILVNRELLDLMEPSLRADIKANEDYRRFTNRQLKCNLSVWGGIDDSFVSKDELQGWFGLTEGITTVLTFDGDHFYITENSELVAEIRKIIEVII